jgi:hypothetical protein
MRRQPVYADQDISTMAAKSDADIMGSHGGRAGWFRVASGFSAFAAIGISYQAWSIARPSPTAIVAYPPYLAGSLVLGALLLATSSYLAVRQSRIAGLFLVFGYTIPAAALYVQQGSVMPPNVLLIVSMLALILATRRSVVADPAA